MQILGLSDSTPRTENRFRALLWPTIRNGTDLDYITSQGFWICSIVAVTTAVFSALGGSPGMGLLEGTFFFFAGVGVRQRDRIAAIAAFSAYLLSALVVQRYTGQGFGVVRIVFLALLLANTRAIWLSARWAPDQAPPPLPLNQTIADKFSDQLPMFLWPKIRIVFYILAGIEIAFLLTALSIPRANSRQPRRTVSRPISLTAPPHPRRVSSLAQKGPLPS